MQTTIDKIKRGEEKHWFNKEGMYLDDNLELRRYPLYLIPLAHNPDRTIDGRRCLVPKLKEKFRGRDGRIVSYIPISSGNTIEMPIVTISGIKNPQKVSYLLFGLFVLFARKS